MKNIFRFWMAVAIIFGAVSCAKEDISSSLAGGEVEVTFTANLPELGTRAYADGANATLLRYWVYDASNGQELTALSNEVVGSGTFTFTLPLIKGMTYNFALWADKNVGTLENPQGLYDVNDGIVTVDYAKANDNNRDAFYGFVEGFDPLKSTPKFYLHRPFAQINAATSENLEDITANGLTLATSSIKAKVYTQFDIKACNVVDTSLEEVELTAEVMPYLPIDSATGNHANTLPGKETYTYLAMGYLLAPQDGMVSDVTFCFNGKKGGADFTVGGAEGLSYGNVPLKQNFRTNILGQLLTKSTEIEVEILPGFGIPSENIVPVATTAELQKAVDEAVANTTIRLEPGVNYGTILIRPVEGAANTTSDCDYLVYRNEMLRKVENLTIVGAEGATVEAFKVVAGYIEGSTGYVVDIKNLVIDGVEFADTYTNAPHSYAAPIFFDLTYTNVDGLTVKNCKLIGDNDKMNFVYIYGSGKPSNSTFETAAKNVTITNNTVDGIARLCELRQTENVTITNNTIKNTALHAILLPVDKGTYSGNVTITNNTAENINERFVRMAGAGDAVVVIKDNVIKLYKGADADYIKVTDGTNVTTENNICSTGLIDTYDEFLEIISDDTWYDATKTELAIEDVADFAAFIEAANSVDNFEGKTLKLTGDIDLYFKDITELADGDPTSFRPIGDAQYGAKNPFKGTFDGQGHTIKNLYQNGWDLGYHWDNYGSYGLFGTLENATVKNVVIEGSESYIEGGNVAFIAGCAKGDCVFENIEIKSGVAATYNNRCGGIVGWTGDAGNYTFKNITIGEDVVLGGLWGSFDSSIGGIVGQAKPSPSATYNFENVTINCRIDAYNDCTASYDYYNYRMCGMIIGRCEETTTIDGKNYPDLSKYNLTFNNVVVNYGDWMNYHYCRREGQRAVRIEPGYSYGGDENRDHSNDTVNCMDCIPFDQLIGGDQFGVKGLREVNGVTVNYPASYRREVSSAAALTEALGKGVSVVLDADIDFGSTQLAITGENQVVDLGGHALTTANNWGGISLKNGATIKNGTITHAGNTAAIKAFNGTSVENVTINATSTTADKTITGIAVQQGVNVESIKNVTINGVSQGIEVGYQATVGLIENAVVNESNNGTAKGIGLVINGGKVGKAKDCTFKGETYGVTLHLKGIFDAGLELENCTVEGTTASIYAWDEKGISNTSGSLVLTYDAATTLTGPFVWDFEEECQSVVTLNSPNK